MFKNSILKTISIVSLLTIVAVSCDSTNNNDPELEADLISTATINGYTVELFADTELHSGYNNLYWKISKDGKAVDIAQISAMPVMHMTMMSHSCPYTEPEMMDEFPDYYQSSANFIMPSGEMGYWEVELEFVTSDNVSVGGTVAIEVEPSWMITSAPSSDGNTYFITWYAPEDPATGNQDLAFMIHRRENMMSFPAVTNAELSVYPYMDMGGGSGHSTPFETPVATGLGMYEGSINYSMSGTWTTQVRVITGTDSTTAVTFEYSVKAQ